MKEDAPLVRRISRPPKDRLRPTEYTYGAHKFSKPISELVKKCSKVLAQIQKHEFAGPFLKPVDHVALGIPDYPLIVKEPMDLSRVHKRLNTGMYPNPMAFAADMRKIWANAILYNPKNSPIHEMTLVMSEFFEKLYKPIEENPFSDNQNEYLQKRVTKLDKKMEEIRNYSGTGAEGYGLMDKPMTLEEKKILALHIKGLHPEHYAGIRDIVCQSRGETTNKEVIEFDINKLPTATLRKLERFVKSKLMMLKMNKKIAQRKELKLKAENDMASGIQNEVQSIDKLEEKEPETEDHPAPVMIETAKPIRKQTEDEEDADVDRGSDSSFFTSNCSLSRS